MPFIRTNVLGRVVALAAACAAAPLVLTAVAHADPDANPDPNAPATDLRAQCESPEFGGVLVTDEQQGVQRSVCQYIVTGAFYYDTYENGVYTGTAVYRDGKTVPTERPVMPEQLSIPTGLLGPLLQGAS